jgi:hypothetical protein
MRRAVLACLLAACSMSEPSHDRRPSEPLRSKHAAPEPIPAGLSPAPPGPGPGPACALPPLLCGDDAPCGEIVLFTPPKGAGYEDIPLDDETEANQYASYLRRDVMMVVQYAAAKVACKAAAWPGNTAPLALGDMSERDGAIPGTANGFPGHPRGTHVNGHDIDVAYYQRGRSENRLRPICNHIIGHVNHQRCIGPPDWLDPWRTALFIGALFEHPRVRVVGVDGEAGPVLKDAIERLCRDGWIPRSACRRVRLGYEMDDLGRGWYRYHYSHMHVSFQATVWSDEGEIIVVARP